MSLFCHSVFIFFSTLPLLLFGTVKVAVSNNAHLFKSWLQAVDPEIEVVDLEHIWAGKREQILLQCAGLILSDGPDVHPMWYGRSEIPPLRYVDEERDRQEFALIQVAFEEDLPILAIGRGFQLLNVFQSGTLSADHQQIALETLAATFIPVAHSKDGIVEAFEWKESGAPFLLAVQWRPEDIPTSPLSQNIATAFCAAAKQYRK